MDEMDTMDGMDPPRLSRPVVFFDGECPFCQSGSRWLLRHDARRRLAFAPLQGSTAARVLAGTDLATSLRTMVVATRPDTPDQRLHLKFSALAVALAELPAPWSAAAWGLKLLPAWLADPLYDFIARHRLRWRKEPACPWVGDEARRVVEEGRWLP